MRRSRIGVLVVGVFLLFTIVGYGQAQKSPGTRPTDARAAVATPAEPDSPGSNTIVSATSQAVVPRLIKFSGALHDVAGNPVHAGTVDVTFSLYSSEAGGDALWFETQSVQADDLGRYTALLGAMHTDGLPVDLFTSGEAHWLGIQVGSEAEQQPRVLLVSVPYALKAGDAETLGGKPASAYMLAAPQSSPASTGGTVLAGGTIQAGGGLKSQTNSRNTNISLLSPLCSPVTSNTGGTANSIAMFDAPCDVVNSNIIQSGSNVGIGTATPGTTLHLVGNNSALTISGTGTHQVRVVGATSGRLGQDANGFFFASDTGGSNVRFLTNNGVLNEWMRITSAGNIGIGTTTPSNKLQVVGNLKISGVGNALVFPDGTVQTTASGGGGGGGGTITGVTAGTDLTGGGTAGGVTLNLDVTKVPQLATSNSFTGNQSVTGNVTATGTATATTFFGSGAGLTNLDATSLFDGITVKQNVVSPNIIAGYSGNNVSGGTVGATISGGGASTFVNSVTSNYGTVGGGNTNVASGFGSTVGGGQNNAASGTYSVIAGGSSNSASGGNATVLGGGDVGGGNGNKAGGDYSTIAGGYSNTAGSLADHTIATYSSVGGGSGNNAQGNYSTIPGGDSNSTGSSADHSFAAGFGAVANHSGTFVWADNVGSGTKTTFTSTATNQFLIRATNGVGIGTASPNPHELEVNGGVRLNTATAQPTCVDATQRGTFWIVQGGAGVKDTVQVCAKDAGDTYAWRTLF